MRRTKYQFKDRATAEEAYREADRGRLAAEWFATAILQGRLKRTGRCTDGGAMIDVGYFLTTHSAFVYALVTNGDKIHCIRGLWDSDSDLLRGVIAGLMRIDGDAHDLGVKLYEAQTAAWKGIANVA